MSMDEDEGHSIEVFDSDGLDSCSIKLMEEHQKKVADPRFGSVASVNIRVSENIQALEDKIEYS